MKEKPSQIDLAYWHEQKKGGFNPETGVLYEPGSQEYEQWLKFLDYMEKSKKKKIERTPNYDKLEKILAQIDAVELTGEEADNEDLQKELKKQKEKAKELIENAISAVIKYIEIVISQETNIKFTGRVDMKAIIASDQKRTMAHNALISALTIANRYIYQHFAQLPEAKLDEFIDQEENAGREYLEVKRIKLSENTFLPPAVHLKNRYSVARWAYDLLKEMRYREAA